MAMQNRANQPKYWNVPGSSGDSSFAGRANSGTQSARAAAPPKGQPSSRAVDGSVAATDPEQLTAKDIAILMDNELEDRNYHSMFSVDEFRANLDDKDMAEETQKEVLLTLAAMLFV